MKLSKWIAVVGVGLSASSAFAVQRLVCLEDRNTRGGYSVNYSGSGRDQADLFQEIAGNKRKLASLKCEDAVTSGVVSMDETLLATCSPPADRNSNFLVDIALDNISKKNVAHLYSTQTGQPVWIADFDCQ